METIRTIWLSSVTRQEDLPDFARFFRIVFPAQSRAAFSDILNFIIKHHSPICLTRRTGL